MYPLPPAYLEIVLLDRKGVPGNVELGGLVEVLREELSAGGRR